MDLKKLVAITDHFPNCASPRKKVVSGFGVGFVSFFVFLFILFSNSCFKNPNSDKVFILGFNVSNKTSFRTSSINLTPFVQNPKTLVESNSSDLDVRVKVFGDNGKGDNSSGLVSGNVKNGSFSEISAKVDDFKDTHVIKLKDVEIGNGGGKSDGLDEDHGKMAQKLGKTISSFEECDIFAGRWVKDDTKPYYPPGSCPYVDKDINCYLNKRPDDDFVKWRWQPFGCEIPR